MSELKENGNNNLSSWGTGAVLIVVGIVLVISNVTGFAFNNWWALFMLIPAIFLLGSVWRDYQANGRLTSGSTGYLIGGLGSLVAAAVFLFDSISWGSIWPIAFVFGGIAVLLSNR